MADKEISSLTAGGDLAAGSLVHAVTGGNSRKYDVLDHLLSGDAVPTNEWSNAKKLQARKTILASSVYAGINSGILTKSSTNLKFAPKNGACIIINSAEETIPDAGITLAPPTMTCTFSNGSSDITYNANGLTAGTPVQFTTTGTLPTNFSPSTWYYVISAGLATNTFRVSATVGGSAITAGSAGSGTHTLTGPGFYIYTYMNSGTMTLEASTTTHTTQAGTGVEIKSGDATRTLVGWARPVAGAWVDSGKQRLVSSYFNKQRKVVRSSFSATRSTASTTMVELNVENRCEFFSWGEAVNVAAFFATFNTGGTPTIEHTAAIQLDSPTIGSNDYDSLSIFVTATSQGFTSTIGYAADLAEGYHYSTYQGAVASGTGNWYGSGQARQNPTNITFNG